MSMNRAVRRRSLRLTYVCRYVFSFTYIFIYIKSSFIIRISFNPRRLRKEEKEKNRRFVPRGRRVQQKLRKAEYVTVVFFLFSFSRQLSNHTHTQTCTALGHVQRSDETQRKRTPFLQRSTSIYGIIRTSHESHSQIHTNHKT